MATSNSPGSNGVSGASSDSVSVGCKRFAIPVSLPAKISTRQVEVDAPAPRFLHHAIDVAAAVVGRSHLGRVARLADDLRFHGAPGKGAGEEHGAAGFRTGVCPAGGARSHRVRIPLRPRREQRPCGGGIPLLERGREILDGFRGSGASRRRLRRGTGAERGEQQHPHRIPTTPRTESNSFYESYPTPCLKTISTFSISAMFFEGSPCTTTRSASFPGAIDPMRSCCPSQIAPLSEWIFSAWTGVNPASTSNSTSRQSP